MFNSIVNNTVQYLEIFDCMQMNEIKHVEKRYQQNAFTNHIYFVYMFNIYV